MPDARRDLVADTNDGGSSSTQLPKPSRFSWRTILVVFAIVATCVGLFNLSERWARDRRRAEKDQHMVHGVPLFLVEKHRLFTQRDTEREYASNRREYVWPPETHLDANGSPLSSWRVEMFNYYISGVGDMYVTPTFNTKFRWDSAENSQLSVGHNYYIALSANLEDTHIFAITGPDSAFDATLGLRYEQLPPNLVVLAEVRDSQTHWMQPGDYNVADLLAYKGRIGDHLHGLLDDRLHVLFADGEVWALDPDAPIADLQPFLTITGAKSHDRDQLLAAHRVD